MSEGVNPVQELSGGSANANLLTGLNVDEYFQRTDATSTSNFLTDDLGSTLALADTSGAVQTEYTYSPFGTTTAQGTGSANSFQFTGRENDGDGLYYYRARYYSPMVGRFVAQDPMGFGGGINLYAYVYDDPTNLTDHLGLAPCGKSVGSCIAQSLAKNGVALGLDAVGFIPEEKFGSELAKALTDVGVGVASTINSAVHQDTAGALMGIGGLHLAAFRPLAKDAEGTIASAIPGAGVALNVFSSARDVSQAVQDHINCRR